MPSLMELLTSDLQEKGLNLFSDERDGGGHGSCYQKQPDPGPIPLFFLQYVADRYYL